MIRASQSEPHPGDVSRDFCIPSIYHSVWYYYYYCACSNVVLYLFMYTVESGY